MTPTHSIDICPICGGGLLGIRICPGQQASTQSQADAGNRDPHGLIICDECEAIWLEPDSSAMHLYPSAQSPQCPVCDASLWNDTHWATAEEVNRLGWIDAVNRDLDGVDDRPAGDQPFV